MFLEAFESQLGRIQAGVDAAIDRCQTLTMAVDASGLLMALEVRTWATRVAYEVGQTAAANTSPATAHPSQLTRAEFCMLLPGCFRDILLAS